MFEIDNAANFRNSIGALFGWVTNLAFYFVDDDNTSVTRITEDTIDCKRGDPMEFTDLTPYSFIEKYFYEETILQTYDNLSEMWNDITLSYKG